MKQDILNTLCRILFNIVILIICLLAFILESVHFVKGPIMTENDTLGFDLLIDYVAR